MITAVISVYKVANFPDGGGHFWVYMQYAQALRRLGCEVYLLDSFLWSDEAPDAARLREFRDRMARYGLEDRVIVAGKGAGEVELRELMGEVDLLLNFNYAL